MKTFSRISFSLWTRKLLLITTRILALWFEQHCFALHIPRVFEERMAYIPRFDAYTYLDLHFFIRFIHRPRITDIYRASYYFIECLLVDSIDVFRIQLFVFTARGQIEVKWQFSGWTPRSICVMFERYGNIEFHHLLRNIICHKKQRVAYLSL